MTVFGGPDIVTDGLVLHLDAANRKSYPGSGSTWYDLSGNNNHGLITNAIFNASNNGVFNFDGSEDYVDIGSGVVSAGNLSVFAWIYPTSFTSNGWNIIVHKWFNANQTAAPDFHYAIRSENLILKQNIYTTSNSNVYANSSDYSINTWYYVGFTLINNGLLSFYKNGIQDGTASGISRSTQNSILRIGDLRSSPHGLTGYIPTVNIYSRALSANEVQQNYNVLKGRYGL